VVAFTLLYLMDKETGWIPQSFWKWGRTGNSCC